MPFTVKGWLNDPVSGVAPTGTTTPVDAAGLRDLETRLSAYSDLAATPVVVNAGNLGAAYTFALASQKNIWLVGTLTANTTITVTGLSAGATFRLLLVQDATGGRAPSLSDGTTTVGLAVSTPAGSASVVSGYSPNATDIWLD